MQADPEDRIQPTEAPRQFPLQSVAIAVGILVVVAIAWVLLGDPAPEPIIDEPVAEVEVSAPPEPAPQPQPRAPLPEAPDIPEREEPEPIEEAVLEPEEPALTLDNSDPVIREGLQAASDASLFEGMLMSENLVDRSTAMVDGFSRGLVLTKVLPFTAPKPAFKPSGQGDHLYMGPDNYVRFDWVAETLVAVDVAVLVDLFHEHRDLFELSYASLGAPGEEFDNAVIRALDIVLATPEIQRPIALERKKVFYSYYDPDLEALPDLQKQMLRMGPDNIAKIKDWVRRLRTQLLRP